MFGFRKTPGHDFLQKKMFANIKMVLNSKDRRRVRRHFGLSHANISTHARRQGITTKDHYSNLSKQMKEQPKETWVDATFTRWYEIDEGKHHPHQETKKIDGSLYVRLRDNIHQIMPQRLAHNWDSHEIDELKSELVKFPSLIDFMNSLSSGDSKTFFLELVSSKPAQRPDGIVVDPKKAKNRNGTRHMVSMLMTVNKKKKYLTRAPIHPDFKPTFREQFINPEFNRSGCCMWNCILNEFKESYDKKHKKKPLSYETIAEIIEKEPGEACWDDFIPLFEKLGTKIVMLNNQKEIEAEFTPEKQNSHLKRTLIMVRHDGHTYQVQDSDIKISITKTEERETPDFLTYISDKYPEVQKYQLNGVVGSLDELRKKALDCKDDLQVYVWSGDSLIESFSHLWFNEGVQARPTFCLGNITRLEIPFGDKTLVVRMPSQKPDVIPELERDTPEVIEHFEALYHQTRESLLNKTAQRGYLSKYSDDLMDVFSDSALLGTPRDGLFFSGEKAPEEAVGLDMVKCYPSILCKLKNIGIFGKFDSWEIYDGHSLEDTTLYQFGNGVCRFGVGVSKSLLTQAKPVSFIRPHRRKNNNLGASIKKVLTDDILSEKRKKQICLMAIGCLGKRYRSKNVFEVFEDKNEALRYADKHDCNTDESFYEMEHLYVVHLFSRGEMSEGFQVIQKMIYDVCNKHLEDTIDELSAKGITALGYKTDSIFVSKEDADKLDYPWAYPDPCWKDIGKIKKEKKTDAKKMKVFKPITYKLLKVKPIPEPEVFTLTDEYDENEAFQIIESTITTTIDYENPTITYDPADPGDWEDGYVKTEYKYKKPLYTPINITAEDAGSGKTYMAIQYAIRTGKRFIVACFSNVQARKLKKDGHPATTLYNLCGKKPGDEDGSSVSLPYDIVIIDELGMFGSTQRLMIERLMTKNTNIQFIATEDLFQLPPIEYNWNPTNKNWYKKVSNSLFPININLTIPKRFDDPAKVKQLKKDLFGASGDSFNIDDYAKKITVDQAIQMYSPAQGSAAGEFVPPMYVSYTNEVRHEINEKIHNNSSYFVKGQQYIAKCSFGAVVNACTYQLVDFDEAVIELRDEFDEATIEVPRFTRAGVDRLSKEFLSLTYVMTCHSQQGSSITGNVVIFEAELSYVSKNWLYVALTRARSQDKVYYVADAQRSNPTDFTNIEYMRKKLIGYQTQDRKAKRKYETGQHVWIDDVIQMSKEQGHRCCKCHDLMNIRNKGKPTGEKQKFFYNRDDWTVDRMDDSLGHIKGNCMLSHLGCNIAHKEII